MLILGKEVDIQDIIHIINLKDEGKPLEQINDLSQSNKDIIQFTIDNLNINTEKNYINKKITPDISNEEIEQMKKTGYDIDTINEAMNPTEEGAVYYLPWIKI